MSALYRAYEIALLLTAVIATGFAAVLYSKARNAPGAKPLIGFVLGSAVGVLGWVSLALFGSVAAVPAHVAIATAPFAAACFVHFAVAFTRRAPTTKLETVVVASYGIGAAITLTAWIRGVGPIRPWLAFDAYYYLDWFGWILAGVTTLFAVSGHFILFLSWWSARPNRRRQLVAAGIAALWGFTASVGFLFPNFGIDVFPLPALLLPFFVVILVYGIFRYQVMDVNLWARRTLTWVLLMTISGLALGSAAALLAAGGVLGADMTFWRAWLLGSIAVLVAALLLAPLRQLVDRLIFPGGQVSDADLQHWRGELDNARDWDMLASTAERLISTHVRAPIVVRIASGSSASVILSEDVPLLECTEAAGNWRCTMSGWEEAPPGPRYAGQIFAGVLSEAAARIALAEAAAAQEGERRQQQHLAELGALAATVAHDLRNPLNIISMAATGSDQETRAEIATQLGRMNHLIADLLDYSAAWKVEPRGLLLRDEIDSAVLELRTAAIDVTVPPEMRIHADPRRIRRVFSNLLANAQAAIAATGHIRVEARRDTDHIVVDVCDDGRGIPADIRDRLFQPFVSRSPDGTGLGLAIAARIMTAHGGSIAVIDRPGWSTCFSLRFPIESETPS